MVIVKEIIRSYYSCDNSTKMDIDTAIEELSKRGVLTDKELAVIYATKEQYPKVAVGKILGMSSSTVGFLLDRACKKIAGYLGPGYQDEKILESVEKKLGRPLTEKEIIFCLFKIRNFRTKSASKLNIFNFDIEDGKIVERGTDKTEG